MSVPQGAEGLIGTHYRFPDYFDVGREKIREFARAVKDDHPSFDSEASAAEAGYDGTVASLTFLAVAGRRPERAAEVASGLGAGTASFEERNSQIAHFDIVVCSTAAPEAVLSTSAIAAAMRKRPARPLLVIDLALPRDVESSAAHLQNVFLYNLDDLAKITEANRAAREAEVASCRELLAQRAASLWDHLQRYLASAPDSNPPAAGSLPETARPV